MKRKALLILGMHRAGTSALARVASLLGAGLPAHLMQANPGNAGGYWEPERIVQLNDRILAHYGTGWDDPFAARRLPSCEAFPENFALEAGALVAEEYGDAPLLLIKDPRCTLLQAFWMRVLGGLGLEVSRVVVMRPWTQVVDSLVRRDGTSAVGGALLYAGYGLEAARHAAPGTTCLTYEALVTDWRATMARISDEQGVHWPRSYQDASQAVEAYLRPASPEVAEPEVPEAVRACVEPVWSWWRAVAGGSVADQDALVASERRLEAWETVSAPLLQDCRRRQMVEERRVSEERDDAVNQRDDALNQRDGALEARDKLHDLYRQSDALLQKTRSDYLLLERRHATELAAIHASWSWRLTGPLRWLRRSARIPVPAGIPGPGASPQERDGHARLHAFLSGEFGETAADAVVARVRHYRLPMPSRRTRSACRTDCSLDEALAWASEIARRAPPVPAGQPPDVSIVVPVYNQLPFTLACLDAVLAQRSRYRVEVLVGDDASSDHTARVLATPIEGVRHIRHPGNLGFVRNCNATAASARGRYLVFLNNDTQVLPGWLDELVGTLESAPDIGLAGSKLIFPDGVLQECGAIVWRDGSAWNYGRLGDPGKPECSYLRDVDYVSGASIALRRESWLALRGFDEHFAPAYAEDADLAFRVRAGGLRTVVQPLSQVLHFEGVSSGTDPGAGAKAHQAGNLEKLRERWAGELSGHRANAVLPELEKDRRIGRRVLFVDHCTPTPKEDAGSVVAMEIMRAFIAAGAKVTFVPEDNFAHMGAATRDLQRIGIEAIYHPPYARMSAFMAARDDPFDMVFLHRFGVGDAHLAALRSKYPRARIVFLNADIHYLREMRQARLDGDQAALAAAGRSRSAELAVMAQADAVLVHSTYEMELLRRELPGTDVALFPLVHEPAAAIAPLDAREGVCFVGGFRHPPNADGIGWFVREAWPLVRAGRPDAKLYIAGSHAGPEVRELERHDGVEVVGYVDDLDAFLARRRLSVAPLRFGAGAKGKVAASLSQGVPVACTGVAAEGMQLQDGRDVLVGDSAEALAAHVLALLQDDAQWRRLSAAGLAYAAATTSRARARERVAALLAGD